MKINVSANNVNSFRRGVLNWFTNHGRNYPWRKKSIGSYQLILAEVLLQRTKADVVAGFFPGFVKCYPSWIKLANATEADLQERLKPIGLWKRRANSLYRLAQEMEKRRGRFPPKRIDIEKLPGIGQYIANAILLFCYKIPSPLLDTNMARVLERYFGSRKLADIRYDPYLQSLASMVVSCKYPQQINWAILDLAALVCHPKKPKCSQCPLKRWCAHNILLGQLAGKADSGEDI